MLINKRASKIFIDHNSVITKNLDRNCFSTLPYNILKNILKVSCNARTIVMRTEAYSTLSQTSKMELFAEIVIGF